MNFLVSKYTSPLTAYAYPLSSNSFTNAIICSILSVTLGWTLALFIPRPSASTKYSFMYLLATSSGVIFSSWPLFIILSSTSVKFCTNVTSYPLYSKYLLNVSNIIKGLAFPICIKFYTVGPHTYIFTLPSSIGLNSSFLRDNVLYNFTIITSPLIKIIISMSLNISIFFLYFLYIFNCLLYYYTLLHNFNNNYKTIFYYFKTNI